MKPNSMTNPESNKPIDAYDRMAGKLITPGLVSSSQPKFAGTRSVNALKTSHEHMDGVWPRVPGNSDTGQGKTKG